MSLRSLRARGLVLPHAVIPAPAHAAASARLDVDGGRIVALAPASADAADIDGIALPGFVDLQVNGGGGRDVAEATADALDTVAQTCFDGGAVAFLPTLISAPFDALVEQTRRVAAWIEAWRGQGAEPLGIHLEGPFLEVGGAHDADTFVDPTPARVTALLEAARGRLALLTLAPGRPGAPEAVRRLVAAGVAVALGHARSTAQFTACVDAGARLVTHLFNAMGPLHHREPGVPGLALDDARVACSLICDGVHVHPAMVRNAFAILGVDRTVLVSDAAAPAGSADGRYRLGRHDVLARDGVVRRPDGTLAGSALTMGRAARNFSAFTGHGAGPWTLARIASANPARLLGRGDLGRLAVGARALCTILHDDGRCTAWRP